MPQYTKRFLGCPVGVSSFTTSIVLVSTKIHFLNKKKPLTHYYMHSHEIPATAFWCGGSLRDLVFYGISMGIWASIQFAVRYPRRWRDFVYPTWLSDGRWKFRDVRRGKIVFFISISVSFSSRPHWFAFFHRPSFALTCTAIGQLSISVSAAAKEDCPTLQADVILLGAAWFRGKSFNFPIIGLLYLSKRILSCDLLRCQKSFLTVQFQRP